MWWYVGAALLLVLTPFAVSFVSLYWSSTQSYNLLLRLVDPHGTSPPALFDYGTECAVCMEHMDDRPCDVTQLDCGHAYHTRCWSMCVGGTCPSCRRPPARNLYGPGKTYWPTTLDGRSYVFRLRGTDAIATIPVPAHHRATRA